MSSDLRKPAVHLCKNSDEDQLNRPTDSLINVLVCLRSIGLRTNPLLSRYQIYNNLACFCDSTGWFVSELVRNPEDKFSHETVQINLPMIDTLQLCNEKIHFMSEKFQRVMQIQLHILTVL